MTLTYHDLRYGDSYVVTTNGDGTFVEALRYVDAVGRDPIVYDALEDIPQPHRNAIEELICKRQPNSPQS